MEPIIRSIEEQGIGLNSDILETGAINIFGLVVLLIVVAKDGLVSLLNERQETIKQNVEDSETRVKEAQTRLAAAQLQLDQASVIINEIKSETLATKIFILEADTSEAKNNLKFCFERAILAFKAKERQTFFEIKEQITALVLARTVSRVKETFAQEQPSTKLINNTIRTLELPS